MLLHNLLPLVIRVSVHLKIMVILLVPGVLMAILSVLNINSNKVIRVHIIPREKTIKIQILKIEELTILITEIKTAKNIIVMGMLKISLKSFSKNNVRSFVRLRSSEKNKGLIKHIPMMSI